MRYVIELNVVQRNDQGAFLKSYKTHIITLSNSDAIERVEETIADGVAGWDSVVNKDDVLEFEESLDMALF